MGAYTVLGCDKVSSGLAHDLTLGGDSGADVRCGLMGAHTVSLYHLSQKMTLAAYTVTREPGDDRTLLRCSLSPGSTLGHLG